MFTDRLTVLYNFRILTSQEDDIQEESDETDELDVFKDTSPDEQEDINDQPLEQPQKQPR